MALINNYRVDNPPGILGVPNPKAVLPKSYDVTGNLTGQVIPFNRPIIGSLNIPLGQQPLVYHNPGKRPTWLQRRMLNATDYWDYAGKNSIREAFRSILFNKPIKPWYNNKEINSNFEMLRLALGIATPQHHVIPSPYIPTEAKNKTKQYYTLANFDKQKYLTNFMESYIRTKENRLKQFPGFPMVEVHPNRFLGNAGMNQKIRGRSFYTGSTGTVMTSLGADSLGPYLGIYDKFDFKSPFINLFLKNKPEIYDRIYYRVDKNGEYKVIKP